MQEEEGHLLYDRVVITARHQPPPSPPRYDHRVPTQAVFVFLNLQEMSWNFQYYVVKTYIENKRKFASLNGKFWLKIKCEN